METPFVLTSEAQLKAALAAVVRDAIGEMVPEMIRRATAKPYLTKAELMDLTGWSSRQVEYKKERRELPFTRRGRTVLFPSGAVQAYLDEGTVPVRPSAEAAPVRLGRRTRASR